MRLEHALAAPAFFGIMALSPPSFARDPAALVREATNEVAAELAECAAYYMLAARGAELSLVPGKQRDDAVAALTQSAVTAAGAATQLTNQKVTAARVELSLQSMGRQMGNNGENFSLVAVEHMLPCKDRVESPDKRFAYWLKEKEKLPDLPPAK